MTFFYNRHREVRSSRMIALIWLVFAAYDLYAGRGARRVIVYVLLAGCFWLLDLGKERREPALGGWRLRGSPCHQAAVAMGAAALAVMLSRWLLP